MSREAGLLRPRVLVPFLLVTLIWGSTWLVIKDQLGLVPPLWSIALRFAIGAAAMLAYAVATRVPLRIGRGGHALALAFGIPQFVINFNCVYGAEQHVTSGLVAVVFALLLVPNSILSRLFLGQAIGSRFLIGSAVAVAGVALLFVHEFRASAAPPGEVATGIGLTLVGVLVVSVANVLQASEGIRRYPLVAIVAWGMAYGALIDAALAIALHGAPPLDPRPSYWAGLVYLGLLGSALAFTLYFHVIREVGAGPAAYSSLLVPIIAMALSTAFEDYSWSPLAAAGALLALLGVFVALKSRRPAVAPVE